MYRLNIIASHISSSVSRFQMIKVPFSEADTVFKKLVTQSTKCIVLFTGQTDKNGKNWCPDCQNISHLYKDFEQECKQKNLNLYVFVTGDRQTWKKSDNYFRTNKRIKINNVPTMGYFDGKNVKNKLSGDKQISKKQQRGLLFQ